MDYTENAADARPVGGMIPKTGWRAALVWGAGAALLHRLILSLWMAGIWSVVGGSLPPTANGGASIDFHNTAGLPALITPAEQLTFGVWRRWDAVHYLDLALNGYQPERPGPTVFGLLTPYGIRALDALLPGGVDLAALVFQTLAFALALALLYRVVEVYYGNPALAPWAVAVVALLPLSYFFAAPMSEAVYLALVLGVFYAGARERWGWAALCGLLATLARSQGVLLLGVAGLLLLEKYPPRQITRSYLLLLIRRGWPLLIIPLGYIGFELYRNALGLPPTNTIYRDVSYVYFTNPLDGLWLNLRWFITDPGFALTTPDLLALPLALLLSALALRFPAHRRLALVGYTLVYLLLFTTKMNWRYGTDEILFSQSMARYTLVLFPLAVLVAAGLRAAGFWGRIGGAGALILGLLASSALFVLALSGP